MKLSRKIFNLSKRSYQDSQEFSEKLDLRLGFNLDVIEKTLVEKAKTLRPCGSLKTWGISLHDGAQSWVGLSPKQLQTTYDELVDIVDYINPQHGESWIDLGAGYGRLGIVLKIHDESIIFTGYEVVSERVESGNRVFEKFQIQNAKLVCQDLSDNEFKLPKADCYFIYDFGTTEHIKKILQKISDLAMNDHFFVVARGKVRSLIDYYHPWLTVNDTYSTDTFTIFRY